MFELNKINLNLEKLVKYSIDRTADILEDGQKLLEYLPLRLKFEVKWTILGGREILIRIRKNNYNVFIRPKLNKFDFFNLMIKSFV